MKINKSKLFKRLIIAILLITVVGFYLGNRFVKKYGYNGLFDVVKTYSNNSELAENVNPVKLKIQISEEDYQFIKEKRKVALDRGLQINEGDNYVDCDVTYDSVLVKGQMRLKGHMTDHLEGDKWSFRVKSKNEILGMKRFSLQHPGTRNYAYEWVYHQLLKNEGVIYLNYDFIQLSLNDKNLGIYALEEHFGQHVLKRNNRPNGAIVRWNPTLYWEHRIDEFQGNYLNEQYSDYSSSFAEPYDKGVVKKDSALIANYQIGATRLELFRRGELITSEVFDVELMAKFHAIIDLVGGHHSLDWSDVKFFYNSETKLVEPVGYESFSIRKTEQIAGQQIYDGENEVQFNYHAQLFSDPVFFEAYIKNLERISNESYFSAFKEKIQKELNEKIGILALEWPYRKFSFEPYYENIRLIRNNLDLPKPFHAFLKSHTDSSLTISVSPVSDFPIQIIGVKQKSKTKYLEQPFNLNPKARNSFTKYEDFEVNFGFKKLKDILVIAKIPGGSKTFEVELAEYPYYKFKAEMINDAESDVKLDTSLIIVQGNKWLLKGQSVELKKELVVPKNVELIIRPNQKLVLSEKLWVYGKLSSHGHTDSWVNIESKNNGGIYVKNGQFDATNTQFTGHKIIDSYQSNINFYKCNIYDIADKFISDYQSKYSLVDCNTGQVNQLAEFNESVVDIKNGNYNNGERFIVSNGGRIHLFSTSIKNYGQIASLNYSAEFKAWELEMYDGDTLFFIKNNASINTYLSQFNNFDCGVKVQSNDINLQGESSYDFYRTGLNQFKHLEIKG